MEKKYDIRIEVIDQIITSKKNIEKLKKSLEEPKTDDEKRLVNSIIVAEQEKIKKLEGEKKLICIELINKKEMYENQNSIANESINKIKNEKMYFKNLILKDEKNGLTKQAEDGKYKDSIQENRARKIEQFDKEINDIQKKIEKNNQFINEINKVLSLLEYKPQNKNIKNEKDDKENKENKENKTINNAKTEKEKYVRTGENILNDLSKDYAHTHLKEKELNKDMNVNIEENKDIDKREKEAVYMPGTILPDEQVKGLYEQESKEDEEPKEEKEEKKENIFKRIIKGIKKSKFGLKIKSIFNKIKNFKIKKLNTASKDDKKENDEELQILLGEDKNKNDFKKQITVDNVIDVMDKAAKNKLTEGKKDKEIEEEEETR